MSHCVACDIDLFWTVSCRIWHVVACDIDPFRAVSCRMSHLVACNNDLFWTVLAACRILSHATLTHFEPFLVVCRVLFHLWVFPYPRAAKISSAGLIYFKRARVNGSLQSQYTSVTVRPAHYYSHQSASAAIKFVDLFGPYIFKKVRLTDPRAAKI